VRILTHIKFHSFHTPWHFLNDRPLILKGFVGYQSMAQSFFLKKNRQARNLLIAISAFAVLAFAVRADRNVKRVGSQMGDLA
jgi:hypothetical protein